MKQLSVFLENEPDALVKLTDVLTEKNINIRSLNIAEAKDFGVIIVISLKFCHNKNISQYSSVIIQSVFPSVRTSIFFVP
ncbi:MAG: hypothetical protein LBB09_01040 [Rickettsiales bacterium]|jgi:hypothetical protein|nr:hypothetical protein [Rickettsiales bacterium]